MEQKDGMNTAGEAQLSMKACPNTWLPKTLTSVQLQPNIAELCPAMVTYSPSNHSPQHKNIGLFLSLVSSEIIQKLDPFKLQFWHTFSLYLPYE